MDEFQDPLYFTDPLDDCCDDTATDTGWTGSEETSDWTGAAVETEDVVSVYETLAGHPASSDNWVVGSTEEAPEYLEPADPGPGTFIVGGQPVPGTDQPADPGPGTFIVGGQPVPGTDQPADPGPGTFIVGGQPVPGTDQPADPGPGTFIVGGQPVPGTDQPADPGPGTFIVGGQPVPGTDQPTAPGPGTVSTGGPDSAPGVADASRRPFPSTAEANAQLAEYERRLATMTPEEIARESQRRSELSGPIVSDWP